MEKSMDKAGKVVKQLAGSGTGQSLMDRVYSAKHTLAGSALGKCVCKATTEEIIAPKKKHTEYLVKCSSEPNVSIPQLADLVLERTKHQNWVVVFKALISLHSMMNFGNERFCQYMASNNCTVNTENFADKSGTLGYDMSVFIRRYGKYLNCKIDSYRSMAFDFCKIKRGKDDGVLRTMSLEKLLLALPVLQRQLDELVAFDASPNELKNPVINAAFIILFKDLIRLFACYNDGIINLLERYFKLEKKQCRQALDLYKVFLSRMDKVGEFLKTAEKFGIDKEDIPDLAKAPASLLNALEHHLATLEGRTYEPPEENSASKANGATPVEAPKEPEKKVISEPSVDLFSGDSVNSEPPKPPASTPAGPSLIDNTGGSAPANKPVDDLLGLFDSLATPSAASPYPTGGLPASPSPIRPPPPSSIGGTSGTSTKSGSAYDELSDLFGGGTSDSKSGMGLGDLTGFGASTVPSNQGGLKNEGGVSMPGLSMGSVGVALSTTSPISPSGNLSRPIITTSGLGGGSLLQPTAISPSASPQIMRTNQQKDRSSTLDLDDTLASLAGAIAGGKKTDSKWVGATSPSSQNKTISSPRYPPPADKIPSMSVNWGNSMPSQPMATSLGDNGQQETGVMTAMSPPSPAHLGPHEDQLSKSQQELADLLM